MGNTILFAADTECLCDGSLYRRAEEAVSAERRAKTARLRREADRRLSLGAGLLLRHALLDTGAAPDSVIMFGEYGKPYLVGANGVFFNLSHSGTKVICAISDAEVGCDVERIGAIQRGIERRFFSADERAAVLSCPSEAERDELLCRIWVMKESLIKCVGLGLSLPLNSFSVSLADAVPKAKQDDMPATMLNGTIYRFAEFGEIDGYRCAVCTENGGGDLCPVQLENIID